MSARKKLNQAFVMGSLLLAAAAGWALQSGGAFLVVFCILIAWNVYQGEVRFRRRTR